MCNNPNSHEFGYGLWEVRGAPRRFAMKHMQTWAWLLVLPLLAAPARAAQADDEDLVEPVRKAIERGVKYLRSQQHDGDWENQAYQGYPGGMTALAVLALLNAG